jgi:ATP-dependent DNA ligase
VLAKAGRGVRFMSRAMARPCSHMPARWRSKGIVSKRKDSTYRSGRSPNWLKMKNPAAPAVKREAEEEWGR